MFKCSKCSNYVNEGDLFCRSCGQKLERNRLLEIDPGHTAPAVKINEKTELSDNNPQYKKTGSFQKRDLKVAGFLAVMLILLILAGYGVKGTLRSYDDVNQMDLSIFAHDGKWTYFSYARLDSSLQNISGAVYKFNEDNLVPEKFIEGVRGTIKIKDAWLYCEDVDSTGGIYKIRTDGTEKIKISDTKTGVFNIKVYGNYIYYKESYDSYSLVRVQLNGSSKETISKDTQNYYIQRDKIYCISGSELGALYEMELDGSSKIKLGEVEGPVLYINDNYIYYLQTDSEFIKTNGRTQEQQFYFGNIGKLYRMRKDGTEKQLIIDDSIINIYIRDNHIYYMPQTLAENSNAYRTDMEGKNKNKLPIEGYFMGIADKWIYYADTKESEIYRTTLDYKKTQKIQTDLFKPQ